MGFMNKLNKMKSFLFDEEEEEKEVKKPFARKEKKEEKNEIIKDSYETEAKEEDLVFEDVSEEPISTPEVHSRVEKTEQKFNFPEFDDDDFMVASKKPDPIITMTQEEPKRILYQGSKRKEEAKKFKPSPIISPIYGLLDNDGNSVKEDSSSEKTSSYNDEITFDSVRKKAYGNLDEEIEDTMKRLSTKTIEEAEKEMENEEPELSREKKKVKVKESKPDVVSIENDDEDDDMILPNVNFKEIDVDGETKTHPLNEKNAKGFDDDDDDVDDTKEQDLFNLIDTMYQNKEEDE